MSEETKKAIEKIVSHVSAGNVTAQGIELGIELAAAIKADDEAKNAKKGEPE